MYYDNIIIKGFGSYYKKRNINFSGGLNVITGSNGSGKSTIVDAIQWNIFGPTGSDRTLTDRTSIINDRSQSAHVILTFYNEYGEEVVSHRSLSRGGKHSLTVTVNGHEITGGLKASQEVLNNCIFNIDSQAFTAVSMMQSSPSIPVNKFITGNSDTKRSILSVLVDPIGKWENTYKVVDKRLKEERVELRSAERSADLALGLLQNVTPKDKPEGDISDSRQKLAGLLDKRSDSIDSVNIVDKIKSKKLELNNLLSNLGKIDSRISRTIDSISVKESDIEKNKELLSKALEKLENTSNNSISDEIDSLEYIIAKNEDSVEVLEAQNKALQSILTREKTLNDLLLKSGDTCMVCGAEVTINPEDDSTHLNTSHADVIKETDSIYSNNERKRKDLLEQNNYLRDYLNNLVSVVDNTDWEEKSEHYRSMVKELSDIKQDLEDDLDSFKKDKESIETNIAKLEEDISSLEEGSSNNSEMNLESEIEELEKKIMDHERSQKEYEEYVEQVKKLEEDSDVKSLVLQQKERIVNAFLTLREQTSVKGIISEDIELISNEISEEANSVYQEVFSKDASLCLLAELNKKDEPVTKITSHDRPIETFSHGEQNRMIMCILLGMTQALKNRYGVWLPPLWDEPTTVIDKEVGDAAFNILNSVASTEEQCFVITRDNDIIEQSKDTINNIISL